jgi:hypothetical protein
MRPLPFLPLGLTHAKECRSPAGFLPVPLTEMAAQIIIKTNIGQPA